MSTDLPKTTVQTTEIKAPKSMLLAYVLWFFLGGLGIHRFYLGRVSTGVIQLILWLIGVSLLWAGVGLLVLLPLGIWVIVDAFLIPGMVRTAPTITVTTTTTTHSQ